MKVLACDGIHEDGLAMFRDAGWTVEISDPIKDPAKLSAALQGVDALLVRSATQVTADAIDGAKQLKVICKQGVGFDSIDIQAAAKHGIPVLRTPGVNSEAVADLLSFDSRGEWMPMPWLNTNVNCGHGSMAKGFPGKTPSNSRATIRRGHRIRFVAMRF